MTAPTLAGSAGRVSPPLRGVGTGPLVDRASEAVGGEVVPRRRPAPVGVVGVVAAVVVVGAGAGGRVGRAGGPVGGHRRADEHRQPGRDRHRGDQADAADQGPHDLGGDDPSPTTYTPDDVVDNDLQSELTDE